MGRGIPGRGYPSRAYSLPRPPTICYNCHRMGHIARDYRQPQNTSQGGTGYANSAEFFDAHISENYYDPHYHYWDNGPWYLDSGASGHIVADSQKLDSQPSSSGVYIQEIKTGGGESHSMKGTSTSTMRTNSGEIKLTNVKYVPNMKKNLISVGSITDTGHNVVFSDLHCWILDKFNHDHIIAIGHRDMHNGLYYFEETFQAHSVEFKDNDILWHRRFGYLSYAGLSFLSKSGHVTSLPCIE
jgi:hypothetical protein